MAKRTFEDGFKEKAVAYPKEHPEKTMKQCAEELGIGYSTLRRWINEAEDTDKSTAQAAPEKEAVAAEKTAEAEAVLKDLDEAITDAAPVLEDLIQELEPVVVSGENNAPLPEAGFTVEEAATVDETEGTVVAETDADETPSIDIQDAAQAEAHDDLDDDPLFASIGATMSGAGAVPHDEDYAFRCKSHPSSLKDINHMAGDVFVSVTAQLGNVVEGIGNVTKRLGLYKKRYDLERERKILKKEKEKRMKR